MFITKKHLRRRTFLRGMGATVALPMLDSMIPAFASGLGKTRRAAFVYFPHGAVMDEWAPSSARENFLGGRILEPLMPYRDKVSIVSGLGNRHAWGPVHAIAPGTWLAGYSPLGTEGPSNEPGATVDQIAAFCIAGDTPLPSMQIATEESKPLAAGAWEGRVAKAYGSTLSFRAWSAPLPMETSPRKLFDMLFARKPPGSAHRRPSQQSVLDAVGAEAAALRQRLGPGDRAVLAAHLDAVRHIERRVDAVDALASSAFTERMRLLFDMAALAFHADMTRVVSFMMAAETSDMTYERLGVPESFHVLSHHQGDPAKLDKLARIQRFHTDEFARFVGTLAGLSDGDGSLLDHAAILFGSNMSDSYLHDHGPLPLAVVGGGCGALRGGRHVRYAEETPISNLLSTLLHRIGVPIESVGDSTGECSEV